MAIRRGDRSKFQYDNGTGGYGNPKNPAIERILVSNKVKNLMEAHGKLAQDLFAGMARRGKRSRRGQSKANADSTRLRARIEGRSMLSNKSDRWVVDVENYADHSLHEEFGPAHRRRTSGPPGIPQSTRERAQHVLNGRGRDGIGVVQIIEAAAREGH